MRAAAGAPVTASPALAADRVLLESIPAAGRQTATTILAEPPAVDRLPGAPSAAAYCGLSPREFTTGSSVRKKTRPSKAGNPRLRKALFLPTQTAARFNPLLAGFFARLVAAGKPKMQAIGAHAEAGDDRLRGAQEPPAVRPELVVRNPVLTPRYLTCSPSSARAAACATPRPAATSSRPGRCRCSGLPCPNCSGARRASAEAPAKGGSGFGKANSVLLLYLQGSPSHIDLWDPKPDAPEGVRGEFKPIATSVPGVRLTEVLPRLARQAHRFTLIRSLGVKPQGLANHGASIYMLMTGAGPLNFSPTGLSVPPSRQDLPSVGAVAARYRPVEPGRLGFVSVCAPIREGAVAGVGQSAGVLGPAYDPFQMYQDPQRPLNVETMTLPPDVDLGRMKARFDLRGVRPAPAGAAGFDGHYDTALALLGSGTTARAFRLEGESPRTRDRYGRTRWGQSCLLARRLVEAGTRFVQVNWPAGSDTEPAPGPDGSWDTHRNNFPMLKDWRCPVFDQTAAALLEDLAESGLLDTTLVVMVGEFGRSPKIGSPTTNNVGPGGRDHWPSCYTCLVAGGGVRPGQVYGESDRYGAYPRSNPAHPYDLIATLYHALGIDPATQYRDSLDRPRGLLEHGGPILALFR